MKRSKVILIVFMGSYRTNGPYSDLMKQWVRWYEAYQEFGLEECHVITGSWQSVRPIWSEGETLARKHKTPFAVLHDPNSQLHDTMEELVGGERGIAFAPYPILVRGRTVLMTAEDEDFTDASVLRALSRSA